MVRTWEGAPSGSAKPRNALPAVAVVAVVAAVDGVAEAVETAEVAAETVEVAAETAEVAVEAEEVAAENLTASETGFKEPWKTSDLFPHTSRGRFDVASIRLVDVHGVGHATQFY